MMARSLKAPSIGRIQKRKTNLLQIIIFGLQRAAGPYRWAKRRPNLACAPKVSVLPLSVFWLNDRKGDDTDASSRIAWVLGYVTAFNQYGSKPAGDVSGAKGTEEIMAWIDNYCGRHPNDNLYRASAALVDEFRHKLGR